MNPGQGQQLERCCLAAAVTKSVSAQSSSDSDRLETCGTGVARAPQDVNLGLDYNGIIAVYFLTRSWIVFTTSISLNLVRSGLWCWIFCDQFFILLVWAPGFHSFPRFSWDCIRWIYLLYTSMYICLVVSQDMYFDPWLSYLMYSRSDSHYYTYYNTYV